MELISITLILNDIINIISTLSVDYVPFYSAVVTVIGTILVAILPKLIELLISALRSRRSIDNIKLPTFELLGISREPMDKKMWKKIRASYFLTLIIYSLGLSLFIAVFIVMILFIFNNYGYFTLSNYFYDLILIYIIFACLFMILILFQRYKIISMFGTSPNESRFVFYNKANIELKGNFTDIYNYIYQSILNIKFKTIEVNRSKGEIEILTESGGAKYYLKINIQQEKDSKISIIINGESKTSLYVRLFRPVKNSYSLIINQLINEMFCNQKHIPIDIPVLERKDSWLDRFLRRE